MPNTPATLRPDVEGIAARVKHGLEVGWRSRRWPDNTVYSLCTKDIPALIEYIEALEEELRCPLGFDGGSEDCSAGTCPKCLSARLKASIEKSETVMKTDNDYSISATDCTVALGDGDG